MVSLLLVIIYLAFISLGLPDTVLGSAWPSIYAGFHVPMAYAGILSMLTAGSTIFTSLMSARIIRRFGTGVVTAVSVGLTAIALLGYSVSRSFWVMCLFSIPYGLGAGSVDASLNNYIALHYKARHMNWLHCFWGVGATAGPYIMGSCLAAGGTWNAGYRTIGLLQVGLVACLTAALPLWRKVAQMHAAAAPEAEAEASRKSVSLLAGFQLPGAKALFTAFFAYCALEGATGLWASSYMVLARGVDRALAAKMGALYFLGITAGRFVSGFLTARLNNRRMVRLGQALTGVGILLVALPLSNNVLFAGLALMGMGCAPIFPSLLHETPNNFGQAQSQLLMGMQMASAYIGATLMPPLVGLLAQKVSVALYPLYLMALLLLMVLMTEGAVRVFSRKKQALAQGETQA